MKKIALLALLVGSQMIFSQVNRFVYQVTFKLDPTKTTETTTENAYLDISAEKSVFSSANKVKRDSILKQAFESGAGRGSLNRETMQGLRTKINYTVEKDPKTQKITYKDRIGRDLYSYEEDRAISWKISPETMKIGEYAVQKAVTTFAGREWTAWFSTDLPYQDGPYKFNGLPGLIIKIEDKNGEYSFDLMKNYKVKDFQAPMNFGTELKVKRTDFEKQTDKFLKDPMGTLSQGMTGRMNRGGGSGNFTLTPDMKKRAEERIAEELKNYANPIEKK